jgi:hypothetical protein
MLKLRRLGNAPNALGILELSKKQKQNIQILEVLRQYGSGRTFAVEAVIHCEFCYCGVHHCFEPVSEWTRNHYSEAPEVF